MKKQIYLTSSVLLLLVKNSLMFFFMVFNKFVTGQKNFYLKKMICFHPLLIRCSSTDINITIQFIIYSTTSPIFWKKKKSGKFDQFKNFS